MKTLKDFIQAIIQDLKLGNLTPSMQKTIEFRIEKMVDKQIQTALDQTLTPDDWQVFNNFKNNHPEASNEQALYEIIQKRPDIQNTLEDTLDATYNQLMMLGDVAELGASTTFEDKKGEV